MIQQVSPNTSPIFASPTEPDRLRSIGVSSLFPEHYGADYLRSTPNGIAAVQRKQFPGDFVSSLHDGRMVDLIPKLQRATFPLLLLEGRARWDADGHLADKHSDLTRAQFYGIMYSIQFHHGISWFWTDSIDESLAVIPHFFAWCGKESHESLNRRPGPGKGATDQQWAKHFLQGLPGVGPGLAEKMLEHFGRVPFTGPSREELLKCAGLGKGKVDRILRVLGGKTNGC